MATRIPGSPQKTSASVQKSSTDKDLSISDSQDSGSKYSFRAQAVLPAEFLIQLILAMYRGWSSVAYRTWFRMVWIIKQTSPIQYLFIASSMAMTVIALIPWISYNVTLLELETITIGSNFKTLFALPGLLGVAFVFTDLPFRKRIYYVIYALAAIVYLAGFIFPNPIHTKIIATTDYRVLPVVYIYGLLGAATIYLSIKALDRPVFQVRQYLSGSKPPEAAA